MRFLLVVLVLSSLLTRPRAISPHETVLEVSYGPLPGQLNTFRIDPDDFENTLVAAYQVIGDTLVYVLPQRGVQSDTLLCYERGRFKQALRHTGGFSDFLVIEDGTIYSLSLTYQTGNFFLYITAGGNTKKVGTVDWASNHPTVGRFQTIASSVYLTIPEGVMRVSDSTWVSSRKLYPGLPTSMGVIWQNGFTIQRDIAPVLMFSSDSTSQADPSTWGAVKLAERGQLAWVFPDGSFVVENFIESGDDGSRTFDFYDNTEPTAKKVKSVTTLPRMGPYNTRHPFQFSPGHIYQLVFEEHGARLIKF